MLQDKGGNVSRPRQKCCRTRVFFMFHDAKYTSLVVKRTSLDVKYTFHTVKYKIHPDGKTFSRGSGEKGKGKEEVFEARRGGYSA